MGLFDKLLKTGADALKAAVSEESKEKASAMLHSLEDALGEHAKEIKEAVGEFREEIREKETDETRKEKDWYTPVEDGKTARERILDILRTEFPAYTVRENVSPRTIGGTGRFMDYSIGVYSGEDPKLFIMLIGKTTTSHREYRWSREEAEKRGYPFINFIVHYPNTPAYISERLHKYL